MVGETLVGRQGGDRGFRQAQLDPAEEFPVVGDVVGAQLVNGLALDAGEIVADPRRGVGADVIITLEVGAGRN